MEESTVCLDISKSRTHRGPGNEQWIGVGRQINQTEKYCMGLFLSFLLVIFSVNVPSLNSELKDPMKSLAANNWLLFLFLDIWNVLVGGKYDVNGFHYRII